MDRNNQQQPPTPNTFSKVIAFLWNQPNFGMFLVGLVAIIFFPRAYTPLKLTSSYAPATQTSITVDRRPPTFVSKTANPKSSRGIEKLAVFLGAGNLGLVEDCRKNVKETPAFFLKGKVELLETGSTKTYRDTRTLIEDQVILFSENDSSGPFFNLKNYLINSYLKYVLNDLMIKAEKIDYYIQQTNIFCTQDYSGLSILSPKMGFLTDKIASVKVRLQTVQREENRTERIFLTEATQEMRFLWSEMRSVMVDLLEIRFEVSVVAQLGVSRSLAQLIPVKSVFEPLSGKFLPVFDFNQSAVKAPVFELEPEYAEALLVLFTDHVQRVLCDWSWNAAVGYSSHYQFTPFFWHLPHVTTNMDDLRHRFRILHKNRTLIKDMFSGSHMLFGQFLKSIQAPSEGSHLLSGAPSNLETTQLLLDACPVELESQPLLLGDHSRDSQPLLLGEAPSDPDWTQFLLDVDLLESQQLLLGEGAEGAAAGAAEMPDQAFLNRPNRARKKLRLELTASPNEGANVRVTINDQEVPQNNQYNPLQIEWPEGL